MYIHKRENNCHFMCVHIWIINSLLVRGQIFQEYVELEIHIDERKHGSNTHKSDVLSFLSKKEK